MSARIQQKDCCGRAPSLKNRAGRTYLSRRGHRAKERDLFRRSRVYRRVERMKISRSVVAFTGLTANKSSVLSSDAILHCFHSIKYSFDRGNKLFLTCRRTARIKKFARGGKSKGEQEASVKVQEIFQNLFRSISEVDRGDVLRGSWGIAP